LQTWFENPNRVFLIAEVALAHDGSLGTAHAYIDAAARAGADAVKFQTHIAEAESSVAEPWRVRFSPQDETRFEYWRRTSFTPNQWAGLEEHARHLGLVFLSSAFSMEAVALLHQLGVPAWKVGAGEITNLPMIEAMIATGKPLLLSAGMAAWNDVDLVVNLCRRSGTPFAVMQCTSAYPCPAEKLGLNVLQEIRSRYGCPVGLSDHSGTIFAGLAAATLGAQVIEVHVVFSRECFGPDVPASVTLQEFEQLRKGVRFIERALSNPVDKDAMAQELRPIREIFGKSIFAARDLESGTKLTLRDLAYRKPGSGIPANRYSDLLNRVLRKDVVSGSMLSEEDFLDVATS
jgi:N,N'-diacetyllegionaminate synthase